MSFIFCSFSMINASDHSIELPRIAKTAKIDHKAMILYFSASDCTYCKQLNEDVISLIHTNTNYINTVSITEIIINKQSHIVDFDGVNSNPQKLAAKYNIQVTPTLLFVDVKGNEVAKRVTGYQSKDFYWYYLDKSISSALE